MNQPPVNEFGLIIPSVADGTQPAANFGTSITPAQNSYGSYTEVIAGSSVTHDCYELLINVNSISVSTQSRNALVTIGVDPAGGTSWTTLIPDLLVSGAGQYVISGADGGGGAWYRFPLFVKAGSSIAAKGSISHATVGTMRVHLYLFAKPSHPHLVRTGSFVRAFGITAASSSGTVVTPGGASEGAFTQLGSALVEPLWAWEFGMGCDDTTTAGALSVVDIGIGDASNKRLAIMNGWVGVTNNECLVKPPIRMRYLRAAVGDLVYGRCQFAGTADSNISLAAYGVGG